MGLLNFLKKGQVSFEYQLSVTRRRAMARVVGDRMGDIHSHVTELLVNSRNTIYFYEYK